VKRRILLLSLLAVISVSLPIFLLPSPIGIIISLVLFCLISGGVIGALFIIKKYNRDDHGTSVDVTDSEEKEDTIEYSDLSRQDVLVGSLGSREQYRDNIEKRYYYTPKRNIGKDELRFTHIALYRSVNLFGSECGIEYLGRIRKVKEMKRKQIGLPLRSNNGEEIYYVFYIEKWEKLTNMIKVRDEGVFEPRLTNMFLLTHCRYSYELFHIHSAREYRIFSAIRKLAEAYEEKKETEGMSIQIDTHLTLSVKDGAVKFFDKEKGEIKEAEAELGDIVSSLRDQCIFISGRLKHCF